MYSTSDAYKAAVKRSHRMVVRVEVLENGVAIAELDIEEGNISVDRDADNRRTGRMSLMDPDMTPQEASDLLHPLSGNELKVYRGLYDPQTGHEEVVPVALLGIEKADISDGGDNFKINVNGSDRSKRVQEARYTEPYLVAEGTNYATAIQELIDDRVPGLTYNFMATDETTPSMVLGTGGWSGGGDPWQDAENMAQSIGAELFFDVDGVVVLRPEPDPEDDPVVAEYREGEEATILHVQRVVKREGVFNHVVAVGNHSGLLVPIRAEAKDENPLSPTYIHGPFGDVPTFYRSTMIFSQQQAQDAADAYLRTKLGVPEQVRFTAITDPSHDTGDVVLIHRPRAGLSESKHIIDTFNIPLDYSGAMNASCREVRVAS